MRIGKKITKGFTLVELLVVVAVLALLASIVFSNLGGAREGARISNSLQYQSQTHNLLGADLIGWWNFNNESVTDMSGYDNNGTIHGSSSFVDGVPGTTGKAMSFVGTSTGNGVRIVDYDPVNEFSQLSISVWVKSTHEGLHWGPVVAKNYREFQVKIDGGYFQVSLWPQGVRRDCYSSASDNRTIKGQWHHLVFHWNGATGMVEKYIDGNLSQAACTGSNWQGTISSTASRFYIGGFTGDRSDYAYDGLIDDVRIYSRALTASEVQTLYAQTKDKHLAND